MREARDLRAADKLLEKGMSREAWVTALTMITRSWDLMIVQAVVASGEGEWLRVSRSTFSGQGFSQQDLIDVFADMRRRVETAEQHAPLTVAHG